MHATAAPAQDLFAPRLYVNDQVITEYEVIQRALFLQLLRAPGDPMEEALKALTEDRLRMSEAKRLGLKDAEDEVMQGMEEFASRANLTAEQLVGELQKVGIAPETFRDFVVAGLLWRQAVRARYVGQVSVSEADIDKAMQAAARPRALKVLASELVIPMPEGREESAMALANRLSEEIDSEGEFASAARPLFGCPYRRARWPAGLAAAGEPAPRHCRADPGPGRRRGVDARSRCRARWSCSFCAMWPRMTAPSRSRSRVEYARFLMPDDPEAIAALKAKTDGCLDLYGATRGLPEDRLVIESLPMSEIAQDIGLELAKLDPGEISTALSQSGMRMFLMLCSRDVTGETPPTRAELRERVQNQKLDGLAQGYMAELKAAAIIREP